MQPETIEELMNLFVKGEQVYVEGNTTPYNWFGMAHNNEENIQSHGIIVRIKKMREDDFPTDDRRQSALEEYGWDEEELNYWRKLSAEGLAYAVNIGDPTFLGGYAAEGHPDWILLTFKE